MGSSHPVPWDRVKVVSALPGPQYPGPLLFKVEHLHFPNNQNCEELTRGAGWRLFIAGLRLSSPRAPLLVLEERAGFT